MILPHELFPPRSAKTKNGMRTTGFFEMVFAIKNAPGPKSSSAIFAALHHGTAEPFGGSHCEPRRLNGETGTKLAGSAA
jgi:hypothetical protein